MSPRARLLAQWHHLPLPRPPAPPHRRPTSSLATLHSQLTTRRLPLLYDDLTLRNSHYLNVTLTSFIPDSWLPASSYASGLPSPSPSRHLPPSHHLVYFNPALPNQLLLPDGTDPRQSPGEPFVRRMWAGGEVRWREPLVLDGRRYVCVEGIRDVSVKGKEGSEKVFVGIERRIGEVGRGWEEEGGEEEIRGRLWGKSAEDWAEAAVIERRNIVFLRERGSQEREAVGKAVEKQVRPRAEAEVSHTFVPTPTLLFRYSALTFNAHAIHLDPRYCAEVEGHRNLLFHGPLSFTLLTLMVEQIAKAEGKRIASLDYRNLAPLYCNEPVKLCARRKDLDQLEVWCETPDGGIAVKGSAKIVDARS